MGKIEEEQTEVTPEQFGRVLQALKSLEQDYAQFVKDNEQAKNTEQIERASTEMRKLDIVVQDGHRCIEVAKGLGKREAQRSLGEASPCIEEANFWLGQVKLAKDRFRAQHCLSEATLKIELAEFWVKRALREARESK